MTEEKTTEELKDLLRMADAGNLIPEEFVSAILEKLNKFEAELEPLKEFARHVICTEVWAIESLDGCDLQELAERLGLIEPHTATADDVDDESDYEVGDKIYKFTELLKGGVE